MGLISRVSSRTYRNNPRFKPPSQQPKMAMEDHNSEEKMARTIFARNISWNATVEDFRALPEFAQALDIKLPTDRETGRPRGFGFIEFNTPEECQRALANARVEFDGREVILAQSQPRQPGQGRGRGRGGFRGGLGGGGYGGNQGGYGGNQGGYGGNQGGFGGQY